MDIIKTFNNEVIKFVLLIKTTMKEIFGFSYFGKFEETKGKFIKLNKGFLFTIEPEIKIYQNNSEHSDILFIDKEYILIGKDFEPPSLKIFGDLSSGETHETECFNNPCFINKDDGIFQIENLEIFQLF